MLALGRMVPVLALLLVACPEPARQVARPPATRPAPPPPESGHPLDPYLGFGRSDPAAFRDDMIAMWEAFQEEAFVAGCMARKGFRYWPDPWGLEEDLRDVAGDLGIEASVEVLRAESRNTRYARRLARPERDSYYRSLYGESLADIEASGGHGEVPPGRDPQTFLRGGCAGRAERRAPRGIWDRTRKLERTYDRLRTRMREAGASEDEVIEAFIVRYRTSLEATWQAYPRVRTYEDLLTNFREDARFLRWLQTGRV